MNHLNMVNLISKLKSIVDKTEIVYDNSAWKTPYIKKNSSYLDKTKKESIEDLKQIIHELDTFRKESIGLEIGAWRI